MRRAFWILVLLVGGVASCAVGAPPGFSDGDVWTVPLVAPLENDLLLVPVTINDMQQPVLFMIDPDSQESAIDAGLQSKLKPYSYQVQDELSEADHRVHVFVAEIIKLRIGDLEVRNRKMRVVNMGALWSNGRMIRGILGRDIISDSLIFSVDRDRGIAYLATQGHLKPPPGATAVDLTHYFHRQLATVTINKGHSVRLHMDLGARSSMLWPSQLAKLGLPHIPVKAQLVDEYGVVRGVDAGGLAAKVALGGQEIDGVLMLPFGDKRIQETDHEVDGALGQNFFSHFFVMINWDQKKLWLKPRTADLVGSADERLARWGGVFSGCADPACVKVELVRAPVVGAAAAPSAGAAATPATAAAPSAGAGATATPAAASAPASGAGAAPAAGTATASASGAGADPAAGAGTTAAPGAGTPAAGTTTTPAPGEGATPAPSLPPAGPLQEIRITRESSNATGLAYDVLLEAVDKDAKPLGLPPLLVTLQAGIPTVSERALAPGYSAAARFVVLDVSPFPRPCQSAPEGEKCAWSLPRQM